MEILNLAIDRALIRLALLGQLRNVSFDTSVQELLPDHPTVEEDAAVTALFWDAVRKAKQDGQVARYEKLLLRCHMGSVAACALELCMAVLKYPVLKSALHTLGTEQVTLELAFEVEAALTGDEPDADYQTAEAVFAQIEPVLCHSVSQIPFYRYPLTADERLLGYLSGSDTLDKRLNAVAVQFFYHEHLPELLINAALVPQISAALAPRADGMPNLVQLQGSPGSGRRTLLRHGAATVQLNLLLLDDVTLRANDPKAVRDILWAAGREMLFYEMGVVLFGLEQLSNQTVQEQQNFLRNCVYPLQAAKQPICLCTDNKAELVAQMDCYLERISLPELTRNDRITLWQGCATRYGLTMDCVSAGSKFRLSTAEICKASARLAASGTAAPDGAAIASVCAEVLPPLALGNLKRVRTSYTLEDIKLPDNQKKKLQSICTHVQYRHKVYDDWNMDSRYPYGKNVSALFVGPPGTGKTMAVHVLSGMLELPLYQIDLSQVVDKYIGETEKRLEEIFTATEKNNAILFFDEADAIFGKRSEVSDAKDKYANSETSYILQRIEEYDGIVILATNYKKNIDEAFMRRIRYLVEFQLPGEELRRQLWKSSFAPEVPLSGVDFDYLARQFEFAGGAIKNIVLNATFMAAGEDSPITMSHILTCVKQENQKMGRSMLAQDFAEYSTLQC